MHIKIKMCFRNSQKINEKLGIHGNGRFGVFFLHIIFFVIFIKVFIDNILVHIIRALNNTTSYDYSKRYVMRGRYGLLCGNRQVTRGLAICSHENSSFCHSSRLRNGSQSQDHPHHRSHNLCVLCKGQCTFHSCCSACHSRSHRSKSTQRVVGEVVEQEEEMRIRPG